MDPVHFFPGQVNPAAAIDFRLQSFFGHYQKQRPVTQSVAA